MCTDNVVCVPCLFSVYLVVSRCVHVAFGGAAAGAERARSIDENRASDLHDSLFRSANTHTILKFSIIPYVNVHDTQYVLSFV